MIIDFHTHIFSPDIVKNRKLYFSDSHFFLLNENFKSKIIDAKELYNSMIQNNVNHSVVMGFPWLDEDIAFQQNKYFSEMGKLYKNKIFPFGIVPIHNKKPIKDIVKEIYDLGLYGIGEIAFYENGFSNKEADFLNEILENAKIYDLPVNIHINEPIGHNYNGKYSPNFELLYKIIKQNSQNKIILSHFGGGIFIYELMPEVKNEFKNVFYDIAATPFLFDKKIYQNAVDIIGSEKILFGTDFPLLKPDRYIKEINDSIISTNDKNNIFFKNGLNILNISQKQ